MAESKRFPMHLVKTDEERASENKELWEQLGQLMTEEPSATVYTRIADLLDRPLPEIQATLKAQRQKLALALLPRAEREAFRYLHEYSSVHGKLLNELKSRIDNPEYLSELPHKDLVTTIATMDKVLMVLQKMVGFGGDPQKIEIKAESGMSGQSAVELISRLAEGMDSQGVSREEVQQEIHRQAVDAQFEEVKNVPDLTKIPGTSPASRPDDPAKPPASQSRGRAKKGRPRTASKAK